MELLILKTKFTTTKFYLQKQTNQQAKILIFKVFRFQSLDNTAKLNSGSSFQILFDLRGILPIKAFDLLVESHVAIVDVIDIGISFFCSLSTVALTFLNSLKLKIKKFINFCPLN
jgi:hypothetical protein